MFKDYYQNQLQLLPASLEDEISEDHLARMIDVGVNQIDTREIEQSYSRKGQRAYHPKMLLKILVYGYATGLRSSRKLANACGENLVFMWLSGRQKPDFRTVSDFRKNRLKDIKKTFVEVLEIAQNLGMIYCGKVCLDGTKMLASSNRHKVQYRKVLEKRAKTLEEQVDAILKEADELDALEDTLYGESDGIHTGTKIDQDRIKKELEKIRKKKMKLKKEVQEKISKKTVCEQKLEKVMGNDRNSFGTVDPDATVMQMKEDYPAPGYNVQFATERQVIIGYGVYKDRTDMYTLSPMLQEIHDNLNKTPDLLITDAGYGSKKNYKILDTQKQKYVIPYLSWNQDRGKRKRGEYTTTNKDPDWEEKKWQIWSHLEKAENKKLLKYRGTDVEAVIGDIKENMGLRRLKLRSIPKVRTEIGIIALAHNFKKINTTIRYWRRYLRTMLAQYILFLA